MQYLGLGKAERAALLAKLEAMPAFLEAALGELSVEEAMASAPDGAFSPVEHCWHLADLEREGYGARISRLLNEENPFLPDFDGDRVAMQRQYKSLSLARGLRAFREARTATLSLLRSIAADAWERPVPVGLTCRLCEHMDCEQRAFPAVQHRLQVDENLRGVSFYAPVER